MKLEQILELIRETEIPSAKKPIDPRADPKFYDYVWATWWDYIS